MNSLYQKLILFSITANHVRISGFRGKLAKAKEDKTTVTVGKREKRVRETEASSVQQSQEAN